MTDKKIEDLLGTIVETNEGIESNLMTQVREQEKTAMHQALHNGKLLVVLERIATALEGGVKAIAPTIDTKADVKPVVKEKPIKKTTSKKEVPVEEKPMFTHADLKTACLAKSREDVGNKPKLKALLSEYGAAKAVDIPEDKLAEVIGKIEKGEF